MVVMQDKTTADAIEQMQRDLADLGDGRDVSEITFEAMALGGVHLDQIDQELDGIGYDRDPIKIIIEPETPDGSHHYKIRFFDLEWSDARDEYVRVDVEKRLRRIAAEIETFEMLVPSEIDEVPDIGVHPHNGTLTFDVEADVGDGAPNSTEDHTYTIPPKLESFISGYKGLSITSVRFNPDGGGWGEPTVTVTLQLD